MAGNQDKLNPLPNQQAQKDFYDHYKAQTKLMRIDVGHNVPTIFAEDGSRYVTNYDTVGSMLKFVL